MTRGWALLQVWWGRDCDHALLMLLVQLLLLKHLLRTSNAAPINRLPFVPHHLLHILLVCVRGACRPKVIHHVTMLCSDVPLTQATAATSQRKLVGFHLLSVSGKNDLDRDRSFRRVVDCS